MVSVWAAQCHVAVGDAVECGDGGARRGARNVNVPAAAATFTWLDAAMLPVPLSASVPPLMVVAPV